MVADNSRVISELTSKLQSLSVAEAASKQQIVHLNNIRNENDSLKSALSKATVEAAAAAKALANFEAIKASNTELSERLAKVTRSLNESLEQNAALKREISEYSKQTAALESLKLEFATLDSLARKLKTELEEKTRALEETPAMESDSDSWKRVESERDEIVNQFAQARIEWEKKEAALMNEYTSLKNLVDELNREVAKFEQFKKEQDELEQKLHAREAELAEKSARLAAAETEKQVLMVKGNDRSAELETENIGLRKKLSELENELSEVKSSFNLKSTDAGSEESPERHERIHHMNVCKSDNTLESEGDVASLRAENSRLQQKNEELRHRNFKILDHVVGLEKQLAEKLSTELPSRSKSKEAKSNSIEAQLLDERKLVASTIGSIVDSPMENSNYNDYINDLASSLKAALRSRKYDNDKDKISLAKLEAEIARYKGAFNTLSALLTQIELGVQERESSYNDRVAQLQSELNKAVRC
uniref:TPR_MLP1_2 domain-containing protein n=1 Tax=Angiostrongylus cantonensis TaxID=6313 RepID=A0A158P7A3_ANGCA